MNTGRPARATLALRLALAVVLLVAATEPGVANGTSGRAALAPEILAAIRSDATRVPVIVVLRDQADLSSSAHGSRAERQARVVRRLQETAVRAQARLLADLSDARQRGEVGLVRSLWIVDAIAVQASPAVIQRLAEAPEVAAIVPDRTFQAPTGPASLGSPVETNLDLIGVPDLWADGVTGLGVVIASLDTGVDAGHPDLEPRWRGGTNSWYDPYGQHPSAPFDANGHGTQTMGVMVGGDEGGTAIGVAPDARWIAARIFNDAGAGTYSAVHLAFQWVLDPDRNPATADAPDLVNNSWTLSVPGCDLTFQPDLQALVAAGIVPVFAAGNFGPGSSTSASPANYPEALAIGATNDADAILAASSRGPTTCGRATSSTFPDLTAPGVDIQTADLYGLYTSATGTSLAAPHVSGVLALLLSAFPNATVAQLRAALGASTVDLGTPGADNTYGQGRIDAPAASAWLEASQPPSDMIFADGFESGTFQNWSLTTGTNLAVSPRSALDGTYGMEANLSGTSRSYVTDDSPTVETSYRARFEFDPNGVILRSGIEQILVARTAAGTTTFRLEVSKKAKGYRIRLVTTLPGGITAAGPWTALSDGPHVIEILWQAAATNAQNGSARLWLDGTMAGDLSGLANAGARIDLVRLGLVEVASGSGTQFFDAFVSTRGAPIEP